MHEADIFGSNGVSVLSEQIDVMGKSCATVKVTGKCIRDSSVDLQIVQD